MHESMSSLLKDRALILVSGKGGVGKSTLSAALATIAAQQCGGACVVESVVHPRLPDLLDGQPGLRLVNVEIEEEISGFLAHLMRLPQMLGALLRNRVVRLFLRTAPAVSEMVLLDAIMQQVDEEKRRAGTGQPCPVIVDLPATGHALTLLSTPRAVRRMLRVGPVARMAEQFEQVLTDPAHSELLVVTLPDELPVNESIEVVEKMRELGVSCKLAVVNQMPQPEVSDGDRAWLRQVGEQNSQGLGRAAQQACQDLAGAEAAAQQVARLREATDLHCIELPRLQLQDEAQQIKAIAGVLQ